MDELSLKFNKMIMSEIGLECRDDKILYDQDNGNYVTFGGKNLSMPGTGSTRQAQEFDPYNNIKMMDQMFSYFLDKAAECGEADEYDVFYNVDTGNGKGRIELKNDSDKLSSGEYQRDQCKYADLILQLNGDDAPDLKEFDIPKEVKTVKKKVSTKKTKKKKQ